MDFLFVFMIVGTGFLAGHEYRKDKGEKDDR